MRGAGGRTPEAGGTATTRRSPFRSPVSGRRPRAARSARRARGFTFLELMVVVLLIGLLSAIVVANMDGLTDRSSLDATARRLGNTLVSVRDIAATQGRELQVEIDVEEQRWRIVDVPTATDVPDAEDREEQTWRGEWQSPADGVVLETLEFSRRDVSRRGFVTIVFGADGQISPAGFVAYFRHEELPEEDGVSVEVTGLTGLVDYARGRLHSEEVVEAEDL